MDTSTELIVVEVEFKKIKKRNKKMYLLQVLHVKIKIKYFSSFRELTTRKEAREYYISGEIKVQESKHFFDVTLKIYEIRKAVTFTQSIIISIPKRDVHQTVNNSEQ